MHEGCFHRTQSSKASAAHPARHTKDQHVATQALPAAVSMHLVPVIGGKSPILLWAAGCPGVLVELEEVRLSPDVAERAEYNGPNESERD